jgi:hypothetical protein
MSQGMEFVEEESDWFLDHGVVMPKREVAEYVRQNEIPVPVMFASVEEGLAFVEETGQLDMMT